MIYEDFQKTLTTAEKQDTKKYSSHTSSSQTTTFALQLQQKRINKRITISDLAKHSGLTPKQLSGFESGTEIPTSTLAQQILDALENYHS